MVIEAFLTGCVNVHVCDDGVLRLNVEMDPVGFFGMSVTTEAATLY